MEFERFESRFKECVSDTAIRTKFEHHHRQGVELLAQLEAVLKAQEEEILKKRCVVQSGAPLRKLRTYKQSNDEVSGLVGHFFIDLCTENGQWPPVIFWITSELV